MSKKQNNKKKQKQGFSIYWLFGKIGDILFIPVIIISLFSSMSMLVQKKQNKPTSFFGVSLVNVLTGSMIDEGFLKGDTVITSSASVETVELGDVIAFYNYRDPKDSGTTKNLVVKYEYVEGQKDVNYTITQEGISIDSIVKNDDRLGLKTVEDAQKAKASIYFHRVIGIYVDDYGNVFYKTKGSNNLNSDDYIRSDFVVGEYVNTPRFIRDTMSFCASMQGMIILVCIPLSMLVLMQCFSLIKQIETMNLEKQLILGKKRYDSEDVQKNFNGNDMETYNKAFLYYLTAPSEREQITNFMYGDLLEKEKPNKKEQKELEVFKEASAVIDDSNKEYWELWINGTKGFTKKKLKKYYEEVAVYNVLSDKKEKSKQPEKQVMQQSTNSDVSATIAKITASSKKAEPLKTKEVAGNAKSTASPVKKSSVNTSIIKQETKSVQSPSAKEQKETNVKDNKVVTKPKPVSKVGTAKPITKTVAKPKTDKPITESTPQKKVSVKKAPVKLQEQEKKEAETKAPVKKATTKSVSKTSANKQTMVKKEVSVKTATQDKKEPVIKQTKKSPAKVTTTKTETLKPKTSAVKPAPKKTTKVDTGKTVTKRKITK